MQLNEEQLAILARANRAGQIEFPKGLDENALALLGAGYLDWSRYHKRMYIVRRDPVTGKVIYH